MDKCCTRYQLHDLHLDEQATLEAMLPTTQQIRMLPTHCISESAELQGFRMTVAETELGSVLPFNREMFYGHSLFECKSKDTLINRDVVRLMSSYEKNCDDLKAFMKKTEAEALGHEASFDCAPDNADAVMGLHGAMTQASACGGPRCSARCAAPGSTRPRTAHASTSPRPRQTSASRSRRRGCRTRRS